jgi:ribosome biogenesis GTPase
MAAEEALILKSTGSWYAARLSNGNIVECRLRGNIRLKESKATNPVTVGDKVLVENKDNSGWMISDILPRKNYIIRKSVKLSKQYHIIAANIDMAYLIVTPEFPKTSTGFIDRFLVTAEAYSISACLIFNKTDLFEEFPDVVDDVAMIYENIGYLCLRVSAETGQGIDELRDGLKEKISLFSGHSGVGKSSIINRIQPGLGLKTANISAQHLVGKHTTTFAEMFELDFGGFLIDTPGIKEFGTTDFEKAELSHYFPEMLKVLNGCKFNNCLHVNEPGCAVKASVEAGDIHPMRYYNYISILNNEDSYR